VDGFLALAALTFQGRNQYGVVPALVWLLFSFGADTRPVDAGEGSTDDLHIALHPYSTSYGSRRSIAKEEAVGCWSVSRATALSDGRLHVNSLLPCRKQAGGSSRLSRLSPQAASHRQRPCGLLDCRKQGETRRQGPRRRSWTLYERMQALVPYNIFPQAWPLVSAFLHCT
jgi:hypothetical protein